MLGDSLAHRVPRRRFESLRSIALARLPRPEAQPSRCLPTLRLPASHSPIRLALPIAAFAGTASSINGYYADYNILATLYPYDNGNDYFQEAEGDETGQLILQPQDPVAAGTYLLSIQPGARLNFIDCTCDEPPPEPAFPIRRAIPSSQPE
jgi:hypothetical protein